MATTMEGEASLVLGDTRSGRRAVTLRIVAWALAVPWLLMSGSARAQSAGEDGHSAPAGASLPAQNTKCPVLPDEDSVADEFVDYEGQRVYLCCSKCKRKFEATPERYLGNLAGMFQEAGSGHDHDGAHPVHAGRTAMSPLIAWLGRFHPMLVHFPIALAMAAALAELLTLRRRSEWLSSASRYCVATAAAGAVATALLGWAAAATGDFPASYVPIVEWHRWLGTSTAAWLVTTAVLSEIAVRAGAPRWRKTARAFLLLGVVLVSATGHLGASLTHGPDYYQWPTAPEIGGG